MFETLIASAERFEAEHQWWTHDTWFQPNNFTLRHHVAGILQHDGQASYFIAHGTKDDITTLYAKLKDVAPLATIGYMKGILDALHTQERLQGPFSKECVEWFRSMGWKFAEFEYERKAREKIESEDAIVPKLSATFECSEDAIVPGYAPQQQGPASEDAEQVTGEAKTADSAVLPDAV